MHAAFHVFLLVSLIILNQPVWGQSQATKTGSSLINDGQWTSFGYLGHSNLFAWRDVCNVFLLRDGDKALLFDLGDGSVLEHMGEIGVTQVEWVLFTQHQREHNQGYPNLKKWGAKIGAPEAERTLFENPASFRKMQPKLNDPYTVHSASYARPPIQKIPIDRGFAKTDEFVWHGQAIRCVETKGSSPGGMSYFIKTSQGWLGFTGDVIADGARMNTYFDSEWDYSFGAGIYALHNATSTMASFDPVALFPSHGPIILNPAIQLAEFQRKLEKLEQMVLRGYRISRFAGADQDRVSKPTVVPHIWQVSPHLYKFKMPEFWPNFHMLLADNGHALVVDCGLFDEVFLDKALEGMRRHLGFKAIDAVIITHMHGDHMLEAPHLHEKWGAPIWVLENMVDKCEHPEWFEYCAPLQSYNKGLSGVHIDRAIKQAGETIEWEGYKLTIEWMPGQTEFALGVHGMIDGKKVIFTGDNIDGNPTDPTQNGHEAMVARNSGILEEGYIYGAELMTRVKPDLILAGHSWAIANPQPLIERYRTWAYEMRDVFQVLSTDRDYRYWFDPFWVRAQPYRTSLKKGTSAEVKIHLRNFRQGRQQHHIQIHTPQGFTSRPAVLDGTLEAGARTEFTLSINADANAPLGTSIIAFDVTLDGKRYGEWFDCMVDVR